MKTYKHKITGNIAHETHSEKNYKVTTPQNFTIPKWIVEEGGDWEEIIEKDYLILEIKSKTSHWIYCEKIKKYVCTRYGSQHSLDTFCNKGVLKSDYFIFKVKKLSDNKILTIGDYFIDRGNKYKIILIKKGFVNDGLFVDGQAENGDKYIGYSIHDLHIIEGPLFTTEDGKEIFEGDEYYVVGAKFTIMFWIANVNSTEISCAYLKDKLKFSTKEATENWILLNKPCLSIQDLINVGYQSSLSLINFNELINKLKALVKSKI